DGIRDFHVTGVQTCALPISDDDARASVVGFAKSMEASPVVISASRVRSTMVASPVVISRQRVPVNAIECAKTLASGSSRGARAKSRRIPDEAPKELGKAARPGNVGRRWPR